MGNWTAAEIQEMQRLLGLFSCLVVLACCCVGKPGTVPTFKLKAPAKNPVLNANGVQYKALILKTNSLLLFTAQLRASCHVTCLRLPQRAFRNGGIIRQEHTGPTVGRLKRLKRHGTNMFGVFSCVGSFRSRLDVVHSNSTCEVWGGWLSDV